MPCRQTMTVWLEKMTSEAAASLREILSLAENVAITTDAWKALITESCVNVTFFYRLGSAECDPADPLNTAERHTAGNTNFRFQIFFKTKISVLMCVCSIKCFYILNKFRCKEEARRFNILIKKS